MPGFPRCISFHDTIMKTTHSQSIRHAVLFTILWLGFLPSLARAQDYSWSTFAGIGSWGNTDGPVSTAQFDEPADVAVDASGNVYVADSENNTIRKITAGMVTTLAGSAGEYGSADGTGSAARFASPQGVAVDASGNVYVADTINCTIRKVTPAGVVTPLAGRAGWAGDVDGTGSSARFGWTNGVAVDASGNVYVADNSNHTIRKVTPGGVVTTIGGLVGQNGRADGKGNAARFNYPKV